MKRLLSSTILLAIILLIETGCSSVSDSSTSSQNPAAAPADDSRTIQAESQVAQESLELGVTKQVPEAADDTGTIVTNFVDFTVHSISAEQGKITSLGASEFSAFSEDEVQSDGTIVGDRIFVSLEITLKSDVAIDALYLSSCNLYYNDPENSEETLWTYLVYQSGRLDENAHNGGVTSLHAGEEKTLTIGFLADAEILQSDSISLYAAFADWGDSPIESQNPMIKVSNGLEVSA